jgi:ABC-2 type transport system permease protein
MRDPVRTFKTIAFPASFLLLVATVVLLAHWMLDLLQHGWGRFSELGFYIPLLLGLAAGLAGIVLAIPGMRTAAAAIFWRNIKSYFSSVIGYVFLVVFVVLCTFAAYWPDEFFSANLANLDQLNFYMPLILLVLVPAITMGIWADERRQGTDELLLTMPATDLEVVLGKYFAAVGIYSAALAFSSLNVFWLALWGDPDWGLLLANYVGFWIIGVLMLAIGMVASVMSSNLTVAFVFGVLLNLPVVGLSYIVSALPGRLGTALSQFGVGEVLQDFSHGVIDLADVLYVALATIVALYLCVVLVGRRHWFSGSDARFLGTTVLVLLLAVAVEVVFLGMPLVLILGLTQGWSETWDSLARPEWLLLACFLVPLLVLLCVVLFGRTMSASLRNLCHFSVRTLSLLVFAHALVLVALIVPAIAGLRGDVTAERLNSLSPQSVALLRELPSERAVIVDAYLSPTVPEAYVQTRLNLLTALREFEAIAGPKLEVRVHDTEPDTETAAHAEEQFGIKAQEVFVRTSGTMSAEQVFLGVAVTSGLNKVVVPFFDRGVPVEYELIRSVATVSQQKRKRIGVLTTDAKLYGGFNMQAMQATQNEAIIGELEKQYEVVQVNADAPITERYDALLAVQPSSLSPEQMLNFVAVVKSGQPTAIFEDPFPYLDSSVPGTAAPKQAQGQMAFMQQPPQPKGDIQALWRVLGIDFSGSEVVWQDYNPYPEIQFPFREFVFVGHGCPGADEPFNTGDEATAKLQTLLFLFPGFIRRREASTMKFESLVFTGRRTGTTPAGEIVFFNQINPQLHTLRTITSEEYVLAAHVQGRVTADLSMQAGDDEEAAGDEDHAADHDAHDHDHDHGDHAGHDHAADESESAAHTEQEEDAGSEFAEDATDESVSDLNVIVVGDIDVLYRAFFDLRQRGENPEADLFLDLDNVTFVLNVLDRLADDDRFISIRSRRPRHRTLTAIEREIDATKELVIKSQQEFIDAFDGATQQAQGRFDAKVAEIEQRTDLDVIEKERLLQIEREVEQRRLQAEKDRLERLRDRSIKAAER